LAGRGPRRGSRVLHGGRVCCVDAVTVRVGAVVMVVVVGVVKSGRAGSADASCK
jgi:hypothetical protein